MIITFDLLNNSIDYLENSFKAYIQANENGEYGNFADEKNKAKFKVSFVLLCQSVELLLKYKLQTINPAFRQYAKAPGKNRTMLFNGTIPTHCLAQL